jgi:parallel beta-helix repeat protein
MVHATICSDTVGESRRSRARSGLGEFCVAVFLILLFSTAQAQSGAWTRKADVPTPRAGSSASVVRDSVYVIGGLTSVYVEVATNEAYDPLTDTWKGRMPRLTPAAWPSSAVVNGIIYCIGGGFPSGKGNVEAFDVSTGSWTTKASMPTRRSGAQAVVVNGVIYNVGGYPNLRTCEAYDPVTNTWTTKSERPESGGLIAATVYNGIIYTFGGGSIDYWGPFSTVYAYDPQTDTWTEKADMPTARFAMQSYLVDGKIYVIGGSNAPEVSLPTVEIYDPVRDAWTVESNMPRAFSFHAGALVNNKIYVIGGMPNYETGGNEVWEYDPSFHTDVAAGNVSGTWTSANSPYHVLGEITVPNDSTLTIEPGVNVVFMGHHKLNVQGRLLAVGTERDSIRFTAEDPIGGWHGIRFVNTPSKNDTSRIIFCLVRHGKANTGSGLDRGGGGLLVSGFDKVLVSNSLFDSNVQSGGGYEPPEAGPAILVYHASPVITKSTFSNNTGTQGSAVVCAGSPHAVISRNFFSNNKGSYAAIVTFLSGSPTVSGNMVVNNTASYGPAGILIGDGSTPRIENNIIAYNRAPGAGGIGCYDRGNGVFINNTIAFNEASTNAGGFYCDLNSDPIVINTIIYGNSAPSGHEVAINDAASDPVFLYCNIEGGKEDFAGAGAGANYAGRFENNIDVDPAFSNPENGKYTLLDTSRCIGAAVDSIVVVSTMYYCPPTCLMGGPRPNPSGTRPDIGACESYRSTPDVTGWVEEGELIPREFALLQNYPNPFNPRTAVRSQLPVASWVRLVVYDLLGREVAVVVNERRAAGRYEDIFDASGLASGLYIYRLVAGLFTASRVMVLMK